MKRYEFIGLLLAVSLVLITYSFNIFYKDVHKAFEAKVVTAQDYSIKNKPEKENIFKPLKVFTSKNKYYRYELVEIYADYRDLNKKPINIGTLVARVYKNNRLIYSVGKTKEIILTYNPSLKLWVGKWAIPWNPELGEYNVLVKAMPDYPGPVLTATSSFEVIGRIPEKNKKSFCAMTLEYGGNILQKRIPGPDGRIGNWKNLIKWSKFVGANALLMLGAETETYNSRVTEKTPFDPVKLHNVDIIAEYANKHNLTFGAWVMSFGIQGKKYEKVGYNPSLAYNPKTGNLYPSYMHISMIDRKRFNDILSAVKRFNRNPDISMIGIDYIRTGHLDGYEMADYVVRDMNIVVPDNWDNMSKIAKAKWFAYQIRVKEDKNIIDKWRWWRAHKSAEIVHKLIVLSKTKKPVWVFTLGWNHGKEHGQDPYMFTDAGVAYDFVMLYEANQKQFRQVLVDWKGYISAQQANIVVGQTTDVKLLDSFYLNPIEEFLRRVSIGSKRIVFGGSVDGIFWHDFSRAFWGRKGRYSSKEWILAAAKAFSDFRNLKGEIEIKTHISSVKKMSYNNYDIEVTVENETLQRVENITTQLIKTEGVWVKNKIAHIKSLEPGEAKVINFGVTFNGVKRPSYMVAVYSKWFNNKKSFDFKYVSPSKFYSMK